MMLCVDNEEKGESVIPLLLVVPNHALYQAKLHPASGDAYHEQLLFASRNFLAGSLDVCNGALSRASDNSPLAKISFSAECCPSGFEWPGWLLLPRAVCLRTKN